MTAPIERTEHPAPIAANTATSEALSSHVFSSPLDFLATLKTDFSQIASGSEKQITKNDLIIYSERGSDPKGRAAAAIAAEHFTDFANLDNVAATRIKGNPQANNTVVTRDDLDKDAQYYQGNILGDQVSSVAYNGSISLMTGLSTAGLVGVSFACPPSAWMGVPLAIGAAGVAGMYGYITVTEPGDIQRTADMAKANLNSWIR